MDSLALYWMGLNAEQPTACPPCPPEAEIAQELVSTERVKQPSEPLFEGFVIPVLTGSR